MKVRWQVTKNWLFRAKLRAHAYKFIEIGADLKSDSMLGPALEAGHEGGIG